MGTVLSLPLAARYIYTEGLSLKRAAGAPFPRLSRVTGKSLSLTLAGAGRRKAKRDGRFSPLTRANESVYIACSQRQMSMREGGREREGDSQTAIGNSRCYFAGIVCFWK